MQSKKLNTYILLLLFTTCKGQQSTIETIRFENRYLFSTDINEKTKKDSVPWKYQIAAADYSAQGDYKNALRKWEIQFKGTQEVYTEKEIDSIYSKYKAILAVDYIIEKSKSHQIVIINEAHHNSRHRVFTKSLLKKLYDNGYKNLGLEALSNGEYLDSELNQRGYPIHDTGLYTREPQFGNLIRRAIEIGYYVFPYEQTSGANKKAREIEQANKIIQVIKERPNEKFLIYCGFGHVMEGEHESWEKTMAGRLTEYTAIDPLTINQTAFSEKSNPEYNHPILKALSLKESSVLLDQENEPYRYERGKSWADLVVFHPNTEYFDGRPVWLFQNGKKKVDVPLNKVKMDFPVMIQAFKKGESIAQAIPMDILEMKSKTTKPVLALEPGIYEIIITNKKEWSRKFEIKVD